MGGDVMDSGVYGWTDEGAIGRDPRDEGDVAKDYADRHNAAAIDRVVHPLRAAERTFRLVGPQLICEDCDGEIPEPRVKAVPGATRCVQCQQVHERLTGGM